MSEYQKYDTDDKFSIWHARLAKDAEVRTTSTGEMVRLTFVSESKAESDEPIWIDATPQDHQAEMAKFLRKGDVLGIEGKLTLRKGTDGKSFHNLRRAILHPEPSLIKTLKERGFVPGSKKGNGNSKPAPKGPAPAKRVVNLDDEE